ncbi:MAG: hypothetical protein FJW40_23975 [Acidobacteria bacterium]|nr:hypothetical protein [Acidobacteriota bacterium]
MKVTVPLTADEARLAAIAAGRGVSPDAFISSVVKGVLSGAQTSTFEALSPAERKRRLDEMFAAFDSVSTPDGIREEAFHRENWYR